MKPSPFRNALLRWYDNDHRDLPWRQSNDFYRVWLSEIMLQQTRVDTVIPYYRHFLERFPTIERLAAAQESDLLTAWSGLGYYSRARNLQRAARQIAQTGIPGTYQQILDLSGIGPYTAAAIASIALGLPHAAVDGNVTRVVSRITNDASEISSPEARRGFQRRADALLSRQRPGDFNQAMMELGATVCKPKNPACDRCPVLKLCAARAAGTERELPVRLRSGKRREIALDLVLLRRGNSIRMVDRGPDEKRLAGFWELPVKENLPGLRTKKAAEFRHQIVNDRFQVTVWTARAPAGFRVADPGRWIEEAEIGSIPLTTVTKKALAITSVRR